MFQHRTVLHELGHAIGIYHTQTRKDRDEYVTVNFGNIQSQYLRNFEKYVYTTLRLGGIETVLSAWAECNTQEIRMKEV